MKIIYILPSLTVRGASIVFEHVNRLTDKGHEVTLTSLDEIKGTHDYPLNIIPTRLDDARKEFDKADVIIGYKPVCIYYVDDIDTEARKYSLLFDEENDYFTKEYLAEINKDHNIHLDLEYDTQQKFINGSYQRPFRYIVLNTNMEKKLLKKKRKVSVVPIGVDTELFYPEELIPKKDIIRLITEGSQLPWKNLNVINRTLSDMRDFELWTFGDKKQTFKSDKHWGQLNAEMMRKMFSSSDIYINVVQTDGIGDLSLQAMACGCAVISVMNDGGKMFYKDGKNCRIIKGKTLDELSDSLKLAIEELTSDKELREELIRGGLKTANDLKWNIDNLEKVLKRK